MLYWAITTWKHVVRHSISPKKKHITFSELTLRGVTYVTALILPNFKRSGNGAVFTKKYRDTNIYTVNVKNSSVLLCNQRSFPSIILKNTFHYYSDLWTNKTDYNIPGGKTGFDSQETKLPVYWNTPFTKICLGMKIGHQIKFIAINKQANSLYSLIADEKCRATSLGRNAWKTLIGSQASLQYNCNKEGFNVVGTSSYHSKARIGIISNNENDCGSCDSRIGFGTGGHPDDSNTCGNEAQHLTDNGDKKTKAIGYILVQWKSSLNC